MSCKVLVHINEIYLSFIENIKEETTVRVAKFVVFQHRNMASISTPSSTIQQRNISKMFPKQPKPCSYTPLHGL